ncbi:hypothetical protein [Tumebacillus flagellatus]|uniref:Uncharacterized protein n=1 Tax=Tumebacillus flagellatus TaxID=1157490 RepID=A0A074LLQ7_9BACL|nr:hypothetical protein [Tumebacillus flagellatus]KEO81490.1 hypothetical protein EL26_20675 [Tumebacillus flagellatus]
MFKKIASIVCGWFRRGTSRPTGSFIDSPSVPRVQKVWMGGANGREIVVQSLPIERYLQILPRLDNIPALIMQHGNFRSQPVEFITAALDVAKEEIIQIIEVASGLNRKWIVKNVSLAELVRFIQAVYEVNEFEFIVGEIKKKMGGMVEAALQTAQIVPEEVDTHG